MLDAIFNTSNEATISITAILLTLAVAFILGVLICLTYMKTHKNGVYSQNFTLTLLMLPAIVSIIILLVGSNVARAFSLAGTFSIIRFRSAPGDPKDIAYVFFAMAVGLALGIGLYAYAALFALVFCAFIFLMCQINFGKKRTTEKLLKITIPENLDYSNAFDDIMGKYTNNFQLKKVRTTDLGTLFELVYSIVMDDETSEKEFIDELRCRNGNLNITLVMEAQTSNY